MTIPTRLQTYLNEHHINYHVVPHFHTGSSIATAISANIPLNELAKAVMLEDHQGKSVMAVLPANHKISLSALNDEMQASYRLMKEHQVYQRFNDCEHGAVPPIGDAYNVHVVCEKQLDQLEQVYIEAGDHQTLICLDKEGYQRMMAQGKHISFSREVYH
ncbi:aminoacyl-tRNA deacylase [Thalassotalea sp. PLHSN55]|uniref:aminoacyl-tRNA deacylase n=1 Tax=Thalassotalea sp. PLHSN55 TaxID=3435888 RepID=UPI003F87F84A